VRTTLDIEDDVLQAARELAAREGCSAGKVISALARRGLAAPSGRPGKSAATRGGVPLVASRGEVVTLERIQSLMDQEGV
jgi:plasmid stability protein